MATQTPDTESTRWLAEVFVILKPAVNDPQGLSVREGLRMLGYDEVEGVRAGKYIQVWLSAPDRSGAEARVTEMCEKLLSNPVIENYRFSLSEDLNGHASPGQE